MRTNKKLAVETLERREVFSVASGFEGLTPGTQVIDALNAGTQPTAAHGWIDEYDFYAGYSIDLNHVEKAGRSR